MRRELIWSLISVLVFMSFGLSWPDTAKAQNGSLYLSPSSGKVSVGETFSIVLRVNTGGVAINAVEGSIIFNQRELSVTSVSRSGSIFSIWAAEPRFSNAEGTIEFAGGVPNPGYSGANGLLLTINFRAKAATTVKGFTEIVLVSGSVLANDGEGTNILASLGKATYYINPSAGSASPIDVPSAISQSTLIAITSTTHPDQGKWYSNINPEFKWELPDDTDAVSYLITDSPTSNPGTIPDGLVAGVKFSNIEDGVNYFHLRFRENGAWGPISHFKFQIDSKPPQEFKVLITDDNSSEPKLTFESSDDLSGIDHYEIKVDKNDWLVIDKSVAGKPYGLINQGYGKRQVIIKAVDGAGNSTTASATVTIPGGIWKKFLDLIQWIFQKGILPAIIVALIALAHEFFAHSKWGRKFKKNLKFKKNKTKSSVLDLRDIRKQ